MIKGNWAKVTTSRNAWTAMNKQCLTIDCWNHFKLNGNIHGGKRKTRFTSQHSQ